MVKPKLESFKTGIRQGKKIRVTSTGRTNLLFFRYFPRRRFVWRSIYPPSINRRFEMLPEGEHVRRSHFTAARHRSTVPYSIVIHRPFHGKRGGMIRPLKPENVNPIRPSIPGSIHPHEVQWAFIPDLLRIRSRSFPETHPGNPRVPLPSPSSRRGGGIKFHGFEDRGETLLVPKVKIHRVMTKVFPYKASRTPPPEAAC